MYIPFMQSELEVALLSPANPHIDLDEVLGDIPACMQSPECTDHTSPPNES